MTCTIPHQPTTATGSRGNHDPIGPGPSDTPEIPALHSVSWQYPDHHDGAGLAGRRQLLNDSQRHPGEPRG
jgi:hypothetical protein